MMNQPMIVWCGIAGVLLFAFVYRTIEHHFREAHPHASQARHLVRLGKEKEMFYVPGDIEDDDFEDE